MQTYKGSKYRVRFNGEIINTKTGRVLKPQDNGKGYKKITLTINGNQVQKYVHRIVGELYCVKKEGANQINHKDGDKSNNHARNLEWVSNSENQIHAHKTGLKSNGKDLWNGKFDKNDIIIMKSLDNHGVKRKDIAIQFGCSKSTISEILNGKRYKYTLL